jgi:formyltetrahydrofolate-dependent phosphoribosylglycinamide formyltransferase
VTAKKRAAILISGRGSNMMALVEAARAADYPAEIVGVFSNKAEAPGLAYAAGHGIATATRSHRDYASRNAFDAEIDAILASWRADIVCLAGFMRILSDGFARKWTGRMLNIHPSLLPKFKGLHPHQQALDAGETAHGCIVQWVGAARDVHLGTLPAPAPRLPGLGAGTLAARTLVAEHRLYPKALALVARDEVKLEL